MGKLLTKDIDYAIRALIYMARKDSIVDTREISKNLKIPYQFLRKVMQLLSKKEIIKNFKGKDGGFSLNKKPKEIYIIDLINLFSGKIEVSECLFKKNICSEIQRCPLRKILLEIQKGIVNKIKKITIKDLINGRVSE